MANTTTTTTRSRRWRHLLLLFLAAAALCWIPPAIAGAAAAASSGGRRSLLGFVEVQGNTSFRCSPSGPCLACQYSEKNDEKYRCSETGYRFPLKCVEVQSGAKEGNNNKQRKMLANPSTSGGAKQYITFRSCVPVEDEEKLSFLGFEVIMVGLFLISGPFVYFRKRRTNLMQGATRIPTSPPRF